MGTYAVNPMRSMFHQQLIDVSQKSHSASISGSLSYPELMVVYERC